MNTKLINNMERAIAVSLVVVLYTAAFACFYALPSVLNYITDGLNNSIYHANSF